MHSHQTEDVVSGGLGDFSFLIFQLWVNGFFCCRFFFFNIFLCLVQYLKESKVRFLISWMCRVNRKHPAGSPDHQTESASPRDGPENLPRLTQETYPAPPFCPARPAALVLHSSSTEMSLRGQLMPLWPASSQTCICSYWLKTKHLTNIWLRIFFVSMKINFIYYIS